jgi:hypothetical protein
MSDDHAIHDQRGIRLPVALHVHLLLRSRKLVGKRCLEVVLYCGHSSLSDIGVDGGKDRLTGSALRLGGENDIARGCRSSGLPGQRPFTGIHTEYLVPIGIRKS